MVAFNHSTKKGDVKMDTMKKFKKYLINFIVLFLVVSLLVWLCVNNLKDKGTNQQENNNYLENTTIEE